jgi:excisionase family DNA binding protein
MNSHTSTSRFETVSPTANLSGGTPVRNAEPADQHSSKYRLSSAKAAVVRVSPPVNMSVLETAAYLGVSPRKVRELVTNRELRSVRIGSRIIIKREWADEFLDA